MHTYTHRKNYKSEDVREGTCAAVAVKIQAPVFESQTKNKLGNTDVKGWIVAETKAAVDDWLHRNSEAAKALELKITANEKLRTELSGLSLPVYAVDIPGGGGKFNLLRLESGSTKAGGTDIQVQKTEKAYIFSDKRGKSHTYPRET